MKFNWFALIRIMILGLTVNFLLASAGYGSAVQYIIAFLLGVLYPEQAFIPKKEETPDAE